MTTARKHKIETVKRLVHSTDKTLTKDEHDFMQKHGYKRQVFMFVHTAQDKQTAQDILKRLKDTDTIVVVLSEDDMKL